MHIALLQETHLSDIEHKLVRDWVGKVYYSSFTSKKRGVAVLIHKSLPFMLEEVISDSVGRFVLVTGTLYGEYVVFGSIMLQIILRKIFFQDWSMRCQSMLNSFLSWVVT